MTLPVALTNSSTIMPPMRSQQHAWRGVSTILATGALPPCTPKIIQGSVSVLSLCATESPVETPFTASWQPKLAWSPVHVEDARQLVLSSRLPPAEATEYAWISRRLITAAV